MDVLIKHDESQSLFTVSYIGEIDKNSLSTAIHTYTSHPEWGADVKLLLDLRECLIRKLSPEDIQGVAGVTSELADLIGPIRIAVIVSNQHDYGMGRYWQIMADNGAPFQGKVFLNLEEAKEWLIVE